MVQPSVPIAKLPMCRRLSLLQLRRCLSLFLQFLCQLTMWLVLLSLRRSVSQSPSVVGVESAQLLMRQSRHCQSGLGLLRSLSLGLA